MIKNFLLIFSISVVFITFVSGQDRLDNTFFNYNIVTLDSKSEKRKASEGFFETQISVPSYGVDWTLELYESHIISENYKLRWATDAGVEEREGTTAIPTIGYIKGRPDSKVSLTFNDGFVYGFVRDGEDIYYIEPLSNFATTSKTDAYVFYSTEDLRPTADRTCATDMTNMPHDQEPSDTKDHGERLGECFEVEYAIASDFLMFQKYGSIGATENHAIGVTNNMQTNYDDEFADELQYIIVEQFIPTTSGSDPWTSSTNASTFLNSFRSWGPSGFGATHDVATIWTDRNFDGSTIGVGYLSAICSGSRYNACEDFSSNANLKRVVLAHELGHNWSCSHDGAGSGFIMAPSVNSTTLWSSNSINSVNNHVSSRWCLSDCPGGGNATADFTWNQFEDCAPSQIQFTNQSTGGSLSYNWSFPGGLPSSSTQENPLVTYSTGGTYDVTLTVTNGNGSDTKTELGAFTFDGAPSTSFTYDVDGAQVTFFNTTPDGDSYMWDFGDGDISFDENPFHVYSNDDVYQVVLTATNECGENEFIELITIATLPTASFDQSVTVGCADLSVDYFSTASANTIGFEWTFEGGTPATSSDPNPTVVYTESGIYDVTFTASNLQGFETVTKENLVVIAEESIADFTYVIADNVVAFTNTSTNATSYTWDFGDGGSSMEENPTHTYTEDGDFTVTLQANGSCDPSLKEIVVTISLQPTASFSVTSGITSGCTPFSVTYLNSSSANSTSYAWSFEGGNPVTSTEAEPTVVYESTGSFRVELIATNANGADTMIVEDYIIVQEGPSGDITFTGEELTLDFESNAMNSMGASWDFGDGETSDELSPSHTYTAEGEYLVTLVVNNACGEVTIELVVIVYADVTANFTQDNMVICEGESIQFTNASSSNASGYSWTFEGGDIATSTMENPSITYMAAGTYDVSLMVSNPLHNDEIVKTNTVTVVSDLVPSFTSEATELSVAFQNTTTGASSVSWDFGDGQTSTEESPSHTYASENIYTVVMTATNECGTFTQTSEVNLYSQVTAEFTTSGISGCSPYTIDYTDASSSNTTSWMWTFAGGDPATSTEPNPSVVYATSGTYEATLTAANPASTESISIMVEILGTASASFDVLKDQLQFTFTNTSTGGDTYAWDFGDGDSSTDENPSHTYGSEGSYEVTLTVTNQCGSTTTSQTVVANAQPTASFSIAQMTGCAPYEVTFTDASSSNVTAWAWTFDGGQPSTSTDQNPTVTYTAVGVYDVSLEVTAAAGTDDLSMADFVTVIDVPVSDFDTEVSERSVNLTYTGGAYDAISWDFGDSNTSTDENPEHTYTENGTYTIILTTTNECGNTVVEHEVTVMSVGTEDLETLSFDLFPNPAKDYVVIESSITNGTLQIIDITGKTMVKKSFTMKSTIDTKDFTNGTYIIRISDANAAVAYKKLVIFK